MFIGAGAPVEVPHRADYASILGFGAICAYSRWCLGGVEAVPLELLARKSVQSAHGMAEPSAKKLHYYN